MTISDICEACRRAPVRVVVVDDNPDQPYRLCRACERRLNLYALRPLEWFNRAVLHGPNLHLLHDDFYGDNGIAQQPEQRVRESKKYPAPTLSQVEGNLERLIDYAMTRYFLEPEVIAALSPHPKETVLRVLQQRVEASRSIAIESTAYEIGARVLGREAEDWIRERWDSYRPEILHPLAQASAYCLPVAEGLARVTEKLESRLSVKELDQDCDVLRHFRAPATLMSGARQIQQAWYMAGYRTHKSIAS